MNYKKLPLAALLLYLSLSGADPMPLVLFFSAYAAGGTRTIEWREAALILVGVYHICLLYRVLSEHAWHRPHWALSCAALNDTAKPTPVSTATGYGATSLIYTALSLLSFAGLPVTVFGQWLFWFVLTSAISFWYTVPILLPSVELNGSGAIVPLLFTIPIAALTLATSPHKVIDTAYTVAITVMLIVIISNGFHIHHSAWPWAMVPLCRHTRKEPGRREAASAAAAGILIGMATQEISGSGFQLAPAHGW